MIGFVNALGSAARPNGIDEGGEIGFVRDMHRRISRNEFIPTPISWTPKTCRLLYSAIGPDVDETLLTLDLFPAQSGYMAFSEPVPYEMHESAPEDYKKFGTVALDGVFWWINYAADAPMVATLIHGKAGGRETVGTLGLWYSGMTLRENAEDMYEDEPGDWSERPRIKALRLLVAGLLFMKQKVVVRERHDVKAGRSAKWVPPQFDGLGVEVIHLRKAEPGGSSESGTGREYHCQWMVRGHWRNQWYPSLKRNQPIWVHSYVKGPGGAPLKPAAIKIMAVTR
jgi:hypothetical protein